MSRLQQLQQWLENRANEVSTTQHVVAILGMVLAFHIWIQTALTAVLLNDAGLLREDTLLLLRGWMYVGMALLLGALVYVSVIIADRITKMRDYYE